MSTPHASWDPWSYREGFDVTDRTTDLMGFTVHATDGHIGKVDAATSEVGASFVVVDTGPWIFGRKVLLPAGTIERVDWEDEAVYVDRSKNQIKDSPELGDLDAADPDYRDQVGTYYGESYTNPL